MIRILTSLLIAMTVLVGSNLAMAAGAIAVDDEAGSSASEAGYGVGSGSTREAAGADAMKECKKAGNTNCKVAVRYDTCGAYAASKTDSGTGWGSSEAEAKNNALEACGAGCRLVVSDCDN